MRKGESKAEISKVTRQDIASISHKVDDLAAELERLAAQVRSRGTRRDVGAEARAATAQVAVADAVESALRRAPCTVADLARASGAPADEVDRIVTGLARRRAIVNVGLSDVPRWFWRVGDDGPTPELNAAVEALIRDRPMTFQELTAATGARRGRVSGAIVALQRSGTVQIEILGSRWHIVPKRARASRR